MCNHLSLFLGKIKIGVLGYAEQRRLDIYDGMAKAIKTRQPYQTVLTPPVGQGPRQPDRSA